MKERAELLGGNINIDTQPGQGTRLHIEIPFNREQEYDQNNRIVSG
jgi:chemotaxis protein histidine kinase CheA